MPSNSVKERPERIKSAAPSAQRNARREARRKALVRGGATLSASLASSSAREALVRNFVTGADPGRIGITRASFLDGATRAFAGWAPRDFRSLLCVVSPIRFISVAKAPFA